MFNDGKGSTMKLGAYFHYQEGNNKDHYIVPQNGCSANTTLQLQHLYWNFQLGRKNCLPEEVSLVENIWTSNLFKKWIMNIEVEGLLSIMSRWKLEAAPQHLHINSFRKKNNSHDRCIFHLKRYELAMHL